MVAVDPLPATQADGGCWFHSGFRDVYGRFFESEKSSAERNQRIDIALKLAGPS